MFRACYFSLFVVIYAKAFNVGLQLNYNISTKLPESDRIRLRNTDNAESDSLIGQIDESDSFIWQTAESDSFIGKSDESDSFIRQTAESD